METSSRSSGNQLENELEVISTTSHNPFQEDPWQKHIRVDKIKKQPVTFWFVPFCFPKVLASLEGFLEYLHVGEPRWGQELFFGRLLVCSRPGHQSVTKAITWILCQDEYNLFPKAPFKTCLSEPVF